MTSSSEILNGRYGELTLDGKKYQYDKAAMPNTWKLWDHETSAWVAALNPLGDIADSGAAEPVPIHMSKFGKGILTARKQDWRLITGIRQTMDTIVMNDDVCIMYSHQVAGTARNTYAIMTEPTQYKVISLMDISSRLINPTPNMQNANAHLIDIQWSGTKWVMAFTYSSKIYIIHSDDGVNWAWPPNNPTGIELVNTVYGITGLGQVRMKKGNADDEMMIVFKTTSTTIKSIYTTTSFDVDDGANETNSAVHATPIYADYIAALMQIGTKWMMFYHYIYMGSSGSYSSYPEVTPDNGVNWAFKTRLPAQSGSPYFCDYFIVGERLMVRFASTVASQGHRMYYTDDCAETAWKSVDIRQRGHTTEMQPFSYGSSGGDVTQAKAVGFNQLADYGGVFYPMMNWLNPISATSGTASKQYISGILADSIENYEDNSIESYRSLRYTGFNSEDSQEPFTETNRIQQFNLVFRFKEVWFGTDVQSTTKTDLYYI